MSTRVIRKATAASGTLTTTNAPFSLAGLALPPNVTAGVAAYTYGSWVQLIANIGASANGYGLCHVIVGNASNQDDYPFQLGTGAPGSEVPIFGSRVLWDVATAWSHSTVPGPYPMVLIAAGSRVAARCAAGVGSRTVRVDAVVVAL